MENLASESSTTASGTSTAITVQVQSARVPPNGWNEYCQKFGYDGFHLLSQWSDVFATALKHKTHFVWCTQGTQIVGLLPLSFVSGPLFGKFLASQPYLNTGGVLADNEAIAQKLIDRAIELANELDVKHLELRHEQRIEHAELNAENTEKVHMRLSLPDTQDGLWDSLKSKVRSQVRKPRNNEELTVQFGGHELLSDFYSIFCRNMRDLGTPPFPKSLFGEMLNKFPAQAEICTILHNGTPAASGFLLHGPGTTLIPSASALRDYNRLSVNMLMYWHALSRSIERGQQTFDFGRSSTDAGTHKFKKQWGSEEFPAVWQYNSRKGSVSDARPNSGKYDRMIATWQKLPVWLTKLIGPTIVRGIP